LAYLIETHDKPGHEHVRDSLRQKHLEWLESHVDKVIAGGALMNHEGTSVIGGLMLVDIDSREEAEAFIANDPFTASGMFARVDIIRWRMSFLDFKRIKPVAR
jgi:uncharacterized protein YciI